MSKATKRKHVTKEVLEEVVEPKGEQSIVKVVCGRGNNLHEVESSTGERFLVSMPRKFRRNVWIKRGDYVIVEPISEGQKVRAEIIHILYPMQIKELQTMKKWPEGFSAADSSGGQSCDQGEQSCDSDDELFKNTNRQTSDTLEFSSSDSDD